MVVPQLACILANSGPEGALFPRVEGVPREGISRCIEGGWTGRGRAWRAAVWEALLDGWLSLESLSKDPTQEAWDYCELTRDRRKGEWEVVCDMERSVACKNVSV